MIVCVCHRVSDRDIAQAVHGGCASFDELQFDLGVATSCGKCLDCAHDTFHQHAAQATGRNDAGCAPVAPQHPQPHPHPHPHPHGRVIRIAPQPVAA